MNFEQLKTPPHDLELLPGQVHIWSASLDQSDSFLRLLYETLSHDERERAKRIVFEKDRSRFISSRGILRNILADYLGVNPDRISFIYGLNGKPALDKPYGDKALYFNLSHSKGMALYAFTRDDEVGVDVEYMRDLYGIEHIAERIFSPREIEFFRALPEEKKKEAFFKGWTRKEAIVKAIGKGFSLPLDTFEISFIKDKQVRWLNMKYDSGDMRSWCFEDLKPVPGYIGAFAGKSPVFEIMCRQWAINYN